MILARKPISRRAVLRGMGVTLALPLLDGMAPAFGAVQQAVKAPTRRLGVIYVPNGIVMENWTPAEEGTGFGFTPTLKPLEPFREQLTVLTGLSGNPGGGPHAGAATRFLTDVAAKQDNANILAGTSVDQFVAREFGRDTQLASLELGLDTRDFAGSCDIGYSTRIRFRGRARRRRCRSKTIRGRCSNGCSGTAEPRIKRLESRAPGATGASSIRSRKRRPRCHRGWDVRIAERSSSISTPSVTSSGGFRRRKQTVRTRCRTWTSRQACRPGTRSMRS